MTPNPIINIEPEQPDVRIEISVANEGKDGHTPVKGEDYWTDEDRQEIIDEVKTQIDVSGAGTVKSVNGNLPDENGNVIVLPELPSPDDIPIADGDLLPFDKVLGVGTDFDSDELSPRWELVTPPGTEAVRFTKQTLNVNQQAQARENIGAQPKGEYASKADVDKLSEEIGDLKENGGGGSGADEVVRELLEVVPKTSKNLNVSPYFAKEKNGVTLTVNADNSVSLFGTSTGNVYAFAGTAENIPARFVLPAGTYTLSGSYSNRIQGYVCLYESADTDTLYKEYRDAGDGVTFTTDADYYCFVQIIVWSGYSTDGITLKMQLESGTSATEYVSPYSDELHSARLASIEKRLVTVEDAVLDLPVPGYYFANNYLPDKAARINALGEQVAGKGDVFAFVTDQHWNLNAKKSPALIEYLSKNCHIPRLFCGGDIGSSYIAEYDALMQKAFDGEIHHIIGNHEYNGSKTGSQLAYLLDMGKWMQVGNTERHYYYVDNPQQKIRYIVLAAFDEGDASSYYTNGYEAEQIAWLADKALATEEGWNVLIFAHQTHFWRTGELVQIGYAKTLLDTLDAYNGNAEIVAIFSGHSHVDGIMHTTGGIPIIVTCCDKWTKYVDSTGAADFDRTDRAEDTITEQAFDVVAFDPENRTLTCVRIGAPAENRVDNVLDGMVEERVVTY